MARLGLFFVLKRHGAKQYVPAHLTLRVDPIDAQASSSLQCVLAAFDQVEAPHLGNAVIFSRGVSPPLLAVHHPFDSHVSGSFVT